MAGWNTDGDKLNKYASSNGAGDAASAGATGLFGAA